MFDAAFSRKLQHDLAGPTWLLVWSHHPAIGAVREDILTKIKSYLSQQNVRYNHVFYLDLTPPEVVLHIPGTEKNDVFFIKRDLT